MGMATTYCNEASGESSCTTLSEAGEYRKERAGMLLFLNGLDDFKNFLCWGEVLVYKTYTRR